MTSYQDPYGRPSFWATLNRVLSAWFRFGVFFGVEVRVLWFAVVVFPLITLSTYPKSAPGFETLIAMIVYPVMILAIIYSHEMMHIAAGWRYRIHTPLITLSPLGGLAHMDAPAPNPRSEIYISLAGPAVHLAWLALLYPVSWLFDPGSWLYDPVTGLPADRLILFLWYVVEFLISINLGLMIFNLLPFYPLDGGRVLRALLAQRMHANRATMIAAKVGMGGAAMLGLYAIYLMFGGQELGPRLYSGVLLAIALSCYFACKMALRAAEFSAGPYAETRAPWESQGDWWKQGADTVVRQSVRPGPLARLLARRRQRRAEIAAQDQRELDLKVDGILERLKKVGLTGLTDAERSTLQRASKRNDRTGS